MTQPKKSATLGPIWMRFSEIVESGKWLVDPKEPKYNKSPEFKYLEPGLLICVIFNLKLSSHHPPHTIHCQRHHSAHAIINPKIPRITPRCRNRSLSLSQPNPGISRRMKFNSTSKIPTNGTRPFLFDKKSDKLSKNLLKPCMATLLKIISLRSALGLSLSKGTLHLIHSLVL